jgi:polyphosphate kinase 2 (PPK2 family)
MNSELKKTKDRLAIKLGQLHRDAMKENLPLIIVLQGKYTDKEKKLINSLLSIFEYKGTSLYTDKEVYNKDNCLLRAKLLWDNIPCKGNTTIFYTKKYHDLLDDNEKVYLQIFQQSLIDEGYIIIKFIFIENGNKSYNENIELKRSMSSEGVVSWNKINLDSKDKYIDFYEKLIMELTEVVNKLKENKPNLETAFCEYEGCSNIKEVDKASLEIKNKITLESLDSMKRNSNGDVSGIKVNCGSVSKNLYKDRMKELQLLLSSQQKKLLNKKKSLIILYEGWDAAGKGGNIKRVVKRLDPTGYKVVPISAPTEEEQKYHYIRRFWRHIPLLGEVTIFDRSWYGRVLVENVERLTEPWKIEKAYDEINMLEDFLTENRCILIKIFINISKDEQLKRFNKRMNNPFKAYKITNEDWRNRAKWDKYKEAISTCIATTSKSHNPWIIIDGDSKYNARIKCLEYICEVLKKNL